MDYKSNILEIGSKIKLEDALTVDKVSNYVGIGTTNPFGRLNVSRAGINEGTISFDDQANNAHLVLAGTDTLVRMQLGTYNNGNYGAWIQASYDNGGAIYGTEPLIFNPQGGNVGIGTTNPEYKLDVAGITRSGTVYRTSIDGNTGGAYLFFGSSSDIDSLGIIGAYAGQFNITSSNGPISFQFNNAEKMRIDTSGNVGIGTTSPDSKLETKDGDIRVTTFNSFSNLISGRAATPTAGGYNLGGLLFQAYRTGTTYTTGAAIYSYSDGAAWTSTSTPSYLSFHTVSSGSTSLSERMVIDSAGAIKFNSYNSTNQTGTPTYLLGTDASGNIVKTNTVPGSAAGPYLPLAGGTLSGDLTMDDSDVVFKHTDGFNYYRVGIGASANFEIYNTNYGRTDLLITQSTGNATFTGTIDSGGRLKVSGGATDQYYFEGARTGVGVTYRLYDNANNIYHDSWSSQFFRLNQNGGSGGNLIVIGGNVGIGETNPDTALEVNGTVKSKSYIMPNTGGGAQWCKIGTLTADQGGNTFRLKAYLHNGYNAANSQDFYIEIFFKTSNGSSVDANGFAGNSWYYSKGLNAYNITPKWVANTGGVYATSYDLYLYLPSYTLGANYEVSYSNADWLDNSAIGQSDPGSASSTVLIAEPSFNILNTNVGIGTTSPKTKLDVDGSIRTIGRTVPTQGKGLELFYYSPDDLFYIEAYDYDNSLFKPIRYVGSSHQFLTGNVGIGTTSPTPQLSGTEKILKIENSNVASLYLNSTTGHNWAMSSISSGDLFFYDLSANAERMRIDASGNVGIGTGQPDQKLTVIGNVGFGNGYNGGVYANFDSTTTDTAWGLEVQRTSGVSDYNTRLKYYPNTGDSRKAGIYNSLTGSFTLYSDSKNNPDIIIPDGNVGIGTDSPTQHISGTERVLHIANTNVASLNLDSTGGSGDCYVLLSAASGSFSIYNDDTNTTPFTILDSGYVGINETNPSQRLHVNGNARVTGFYYDSTDSAGTPGYVLSSTSSGTEWVTADSVISYKWYAVSDGGLASASISNSTSLDFQGGTGISTFTSGSGSAYTIEFTNTDRGSAQNIFKNVAGPTGQPTIVAASNNDTVTLKDDRFITITTNNSTKTAQFSPKALEVCDFLLAFKSPSAQTNYLVWVNGSYQSTTGSETYKTALYAGEIDVVKIISDVTVSGVYIDVYETGAPTTPIWSSGSTNLTANTLMSFSPSGATFSASDQLYATIAIPTSATVVYRLDFGLLYS